MLLCLACAEAAWSISKPPAESASAGYALIPLDAGNFTRGVPDGLAVDGSGNLVAIGGAETGDIRVLQTNRGREELIQVPLGATAGQQLSQNGQRFFFRGIFQLPTFLFEGIGYYDFGSGQIQRGPGTSSERFTADSTGEHVAFQSADDLDPRVGNPNRRVQYFFYDDTTGDIRQLTTDPNAIRENVSRQVCPRGDGTTPLISGDGTRVIVITGVPLGIVPEDPLVGCYIFEYTAPTSAWRYVTGLPLGISLDSPVLSNDGRWLSFTSVRTVPPGIRRSFPALLDVETGALTDPLAGIADVPSFDAVVTGDGSKVVISSQADLDPHVGNADHNMELFVYDRAEDSFVQVTKTVGGIGRNPGGCPNYRPVVNDDGRVMLFLFVYPGESCLADGPQRVESNGFAFGRVRAQRRRPGNQVPTLRVSDRARVVAGYTLDLNLRADDPDGDAITFFAQVLGGLDVPPGSEMQDHHNGTARLNWPTDSGVVGVHTVRVAAFDEGGGEVVQDIEITVRADSCAGDCDGNSQVTIDELVTGVRIALGQAPTNRCAAFDLNGSESVTIDELLTAIQDSLTGCIPLTP